MAKVWFCVFLLCTQKKSNVCPGKMNKMTQNVRHMFLMLLSQTEHRRIFSLWDSVTHIAMICQDLAKIHCHMECIRVWLLSSPLLFSPLLSSPLLYQQKPTVKSTDWPNTIKPTWESVAVWFWWQKILMTMTWYGSKHLVK